MNRVLTVGWPILAGVGLMFPDSIRAADELVANGATKASATEIRFDSKPPSIWATEEGMGFRRSLAHASVVAGVAPGFHRFGSPQAHHLALAGISYGKMWGGVQATNHWWRGNWEWRVELLGGSEFSPSVHYFVGLTPHLRYNYATGTRWIPYVDFGSGVSATSIGAPDLGGHFQFNTQFGFGFNFFLKDNLALSFDTRAMHVSSAGISQPNAGMNNVLIMAGVSWFY